MPSSTSPTPPTPKDITLLTPILTPHHPPATTAALIRALPPHLLRAPTLFSFPFFPPLSTLDFCPLHAPFSPAPLLHLQHLLLHSLPRRLTHLLHAPPATLHPTTLALLAALERLLSTLEARTQRQSGNCVACALALVGGDVEGLGALRGWVWSQRKKGERGGRGRLEGWVEGWVDGLGGEVGGEVRRGSGRVGKVVGRDRRGLRARRRGLQRDARTGGGGGGNRERGRENEDDDGGRESEDDEGWEEKVVEAYQGWETEEESEESMDGRRGSEGFALGDGDEGKARFVGAADESGDAERRAEEYRMLLGPRPELGTPGSSSVSVRRGPGSAPRTGQMESDVAERRETTSQKARATRRSHR